MNLIEIVYQNEEIFIINKPAGLACQGGQGVKHSLDVDFSQQVGQKVYLVHRLDKETAGLMIVAKNPSAATKWTRLVGTKAARKEYLAICCGSLKEKKGQITEDIIQHGEKRRAVTNYFVEKEWDVELWEGDFEPRGGAASEAGVPGGGATLYNDTARVPEGGLGVPTGDPAVPTSAPSIIHFSQVRLHLQTGRMHQIRIHLAKNACPIAGDDQHGNFKINKLLKKKLKIKHLLLLSQKLTVPIDGKNLTFEVPVPEYFQVYV